MKRKKCENLYGPRWALWIAFFSVAVLLCNGGILQATAISGNVQADISVKKRPLKEVVNSVHEQTGYRIELKSIDESFLVTGQYSNVAVEKIFTHLLKGHNISIAINTPDKLISVISLGGKIQRAKNSQELDSIPSVAIDTPTPESIPPAVIEADAIALEKSVNDQSLELTGLSNQDVQSLHAQQAREFEQQHNDANAVDPLTGLPTTELEDMHKKQIMESNQAVK
jgi:hypothetical protein